MVVFVLSDDSYKNNMSHDDLSPVCFFFFNFGVKLLQLIHIHVPVYTRLALKGQEMEIHLVAF